MTNALAQWYSLLKVINFGLGHVTVPGFVSPCPCRAVCTVRTLPTKLENITKPKKSKNTAKTSCNGTPQHAQRSEEHCHFISCVMKNYPFFSTRVMSPTACPTLKGQVYVVQARWK
eukprot:2601125-Amphidinium_carterae.1